MPKPRTTTGEKNLISSHLKELRQQIGSKTCFKDFEPYSFQNKILNYSAAERNMQALLCTISYFFLSASLLFYHNPSDI